MRIWAAILGIAAMLTAAAAPKNAAPAAAAARPDRDIAFFRALNESDPAKRGETLLLLAESREYPAELALIRLARTAQLPPRSTGRLLKIARFRFGELVPTVLLVRAFRQEDDAAAAEPMDRNELFTLAHAAWKNAAARELPPFEHQLYRELSGQVLLLAGECGEAARLLPEIERRLGAGNGQWRRDIPFSALLEFLYRCAFVNEGFELYAPGWKKAGAPCRRALAAALGEMSQYPPEDSAEAEARIDFLLAVGDGPGAIQLAARQVRDDQRRWLGKLVFTAVKSGDTKALAMLKEFLRPAAYAELQASALTYGGKYREALKLLPGVADAELRTQLEVRCRIALGEFAAAAKLLADPAAPLGKRARILALLELAELGNDRALYREAEKLAGKTIDADAGLSNAFGYVALALGLDRDAAERRIGHALKLRPRESAFLDSMAWARYSAGDFPGAWKFMEESLRLAAPDPECCECLKHAAAIRLALGDREGARKYCAQALALARTHEEQARYRIFAESIRKMQEQMK